MGLREVFEQGDAWRRGGNHAPDGLPSGRDAEKKVLGIPTGPLKTEYQKFDDAIAYAKDHQPSLFERSTIVKTLRASIADMCRNKQTPVKFFTAVGTPLDMYHGVDAFIEQGGRIVTLDVTLADKSSSKADVILYLDMNDEEVVSVDPKHLQGVATVIAQKLNGH